MHLTRATRLLALLALWLLVTLGARPLLLPDEGRYGNVARDMLTHGQFWVPMLNGLPFFHKPPLLYWLDIAAMSVLGVNAFAARFGSFVGAWLLAASVFLAVRRWHGARAAVAVLVVLATTPMFFIGAQYDNHDMLVGGLITAAVLAFVRAVETPFPPLRWVLTAWLLAALAMLAKGLIGIVLPALVVGPWLLAHRRWREVLRLLHPAGLAVFALVGLPWFAAMQLHYPGFFDYFVIEQHFRRFAQHDFNNVQPAWFYPAVLVLLTLPWSAWLPWAVRDARARRDWQGSDHISLYVWWIVAIVGFFTLPSSKLVGYVLPALAPWCLLLAAPAARRTRAAQAMAAVGALACLAVVGALVWKTPHSSRAAAQVLAARIEAGDAVVFVDEMFYDLPFYAGLREPPIVASNWSDPGIALHDNWRKELADAARFDPARASQVLQPLSRLPALTCRANATWFVARPGEPQALKAVPSLSRVYADRDVVLWRAPGRAC